MSAAADPKPRTPMLAVQHAARLLRLGSVVRIVNGSQMLDALAAEAVISEGQAGRLQDLPRAT